MASPRRQPADGRPAAEGGSRSEAARPERRDACSCSRRATARVDVIRRLVAAGADVNAREELRGTTALMWAAEQRHPGGGEGAAGRRRESGNRLRPRGPAAELHGAARQRERGRGGAAAPRARGGGGTHVRRAGRPSNAGRCLAPAARRQVRPIRPTDDDTLVQAGLVGGGGGGLTALVFAAREGRRRIREGAARRRREDQSGDRVRLDAAADGHQQPQLRARGAADRTRRRRQHRRTRAAGRRCTSPPTTATSKGAITRCRSPDLDHLEIISVAADTRRRPERAASATTR